MLQNASSAACLCWTTGLRVCSENTDQCYSFQPSVLLIVWMTAKCKLLCIRTPPPHTHTLFCTNTHAFSQANNTLLVQRRAWRQRGVSRQRHAVRCTNCLCHLSTANTDGVMGVFKRKGGRQRKRETMTEQQCVSLQPRAMCSMLTAWLGSVPEAYSEPRTAPLVSELAHLGETHLDKVSLSLFIAPVFPFSKTRSVSSGSPHLAALSSFVCRSVRTPGGTSNL